MLIKRRTQIFDDNEIKMNISTSSPLHLIIEIKLNKNNQDTFLDKYFIYFA